MLRPVPGIEASAIRRRPANCPTSPLAATAIRRSCCLGLSDDLATCTPTLTGCRPPSVNAGKACPAGPQPAGHLQSCEMFRRERLYIADEVRSKLDSSKRLRVASKLSTRT